MSIVRKRIVIIVLQYSVVVKGIEKKLTDSGYIASVLSDDLDRIPDHASTTDLFILYLPNDVPDKFDVLEKVSYVCKKVDSSGKGLILVGEARDKDELLIKLPKLSGYKWVNRPIDMDILTPIIESLFEKSKTPGEEKRILIVDDDPSYAKMIREWIKDKYHTDIVTAGMQAITFLLKHKVDLILLDYEMPVVDGPQVLQMLRQEPSTEHIPVFFLTGVGTKEAVNRVMALRPDGYILKSTSRDKLLKYLEEKLG